MSGDDSAVAQHQPGLFAVKGHFLALPDNFIAAWVAVQQLFYNPPVNNMFPDDSPRVFGNKFLIDNAFRIDDYGWAHAAIADTADNFYGDLPGQAFLLQLVIEGLFHLAAAQ